MGKQLLQNLLITSIAGALLALMFTFWDIKFLHGWIGASIFLFFIASGLGDEDFKIKAKNNTEKFVSHMIQIVSYVLMSAFLLALILFGICMMLTL